MKIIINKEALLLDFLFELYSDSPRSRTKKLLQNGCVSINNKIVTSYAYKLKTGDILEVNTHTGLTLKSVLPFPVLYEDADVIVIDKPVGIVTSSTDDTTSIQWIVSQYYKVQSKGKSRIYVVHRLDKEVSGILLLAKTQLAMNTIKDHWKETEKKYIALVEGKTEKPEGIIKSWLVEDRSQKVHSTSNPINAKLAVTHYRTIEQVKDNTLLEVRLETGRKNQIRVHLSDIGCPIVGDRKYNASDKYIRRIRFHACYLSFPHPTSGKKIVIESPLPKGFLSLKDKDEKYK